MPVSKFPEKLFGNLLADGQVNAYTTLAGAADRAGPIRVGVYQLVEVVEATFVESVSTTKVEN